LFQNKELKKRYDSIPDEIGDITETGDFKSDAEI